jgi:hypothetical protein
MTTASEATDAKIGAAEARLRGEMGIGNSELLARIDQFASKFDAKFDAVNAKFDAQFDAVNTKFDAKFDAVNARLTHIEDQNRSTRANIWSAAAFVVGSMIAIIALLATVAPYAFDKGADFHDRVAREVSAQLARR